REWVLLDRSLKKIRFLRQVLIELEPGRVEIVHARAEDYRPEPAFSTVISRAVGSLDRLVRLAMPVSRDDGRILAMKGCYPAAEIEALGSGVPEARVHRLEVPALTEPRHLVVIRVGSDNARGYYGGGYRGSV
ncbi:MAG: 16S rRNA (guanine(527)-N(7))-methyltransferase RsmG, partial [Gammaproteobacteria bacterium]